MEQQEQFFTSQITCHFNLRHPNNEKPSIIYMVVGFQGKQYKISLDCKVIPTQWSKRQQQAHISPLLTELDNRNNFVVNSKISRFRFLFMETLKYICDNPSELEGFINRLLDNVKTKEKKMKKENAISWLSADLDKAPMKDGSRRIYQNAIDDLFKYCQSIGRLPLQWGDINYKFLKDFERWLMDCGIKNDKTVGETIAKLITRLRNAAKEDKIDLHRSGIDKYSKPKVSYQQEENTFALSLEELEALQSLHLKGVEAKVRDLFIFQVWSGQRFSDLVNINNGIIDREKKTIKIVQIKTNEFVTIPILPSALEILNKYDWQLPKVSMMEYNSTLKAIARKAKLTREHLKQSQHKGQPTAVKVKICDDIASHSARRTFVTLMITYDYLSKEQAMQITGHRTDSAFKRYMKLDGDEVAARAIAKFYGPETHKNKQPQPIQQPHLAMNNDFLENFKVEAIRRSELEKQVQQQEQTIEQLDALVKQQSQELEMASVFDADDYSDRVAELALESMYDNMKFHNELP